MGVVCWVSSLELSFLSTWFILTVLSIISVFGMSFLVFYPLYYRPTYDRWRFKFNPKYPTPQKVKEEILVTMQGIPLSALPAAMSLILMRYDLSQAYCGAVTEQYGIDWLFISFAIIWLFSDVYEWLYHWSGHKFNAMWNFHKEHHHFANPTPFAVVADGMVDQFFRALPLLILPLMFPINMDLIFFTFGFVFFVNGLSQHCGYDFGFDFVFGEKLFEEHKQSKSLVWKMILYFRKNLSAHGTWILGSYHHYLHHALSTVGNPFFNGQFLQIWDIWAGSVYDKNREKPCLCSACCRERGERTIEEWEKVHKMDYSVFFSPAFWIY